jgi:hypothetical protein
MDLQDTFYLAVFGNSVVPWVSKEDHRSEFIVKTKLVIGS